MITREKLRESLYYDDEWIALWVPPSGITVYQYAALPIPAADRHWAIVCTAQLADSILRQHACWCARRALALVQHPDPRSIVAVEVAERYALGEATEIELSVAIDAACNACDAARDAAIAAAMAAAGEVEMNVRAAAMAAANAAARDASGATAWAAEWDAALIDLVSRAELRPGEQSSGINITNVEADARLVHDESHEDDEIS